MALIDDIAYASASTLLDSYRKKALSPVEVTLALLDRIEALQPKINAFCIVDRDGALGCGARVGSALAAGRGNRPRSTACR